MKLYYAQATPLKIYETTLEDEMNRPYYFKYEDKGDTITIYSKHKDPQTADVYEDGEYLVTVIRSKYKKQLINNIIISYEDSIKRLNDTLNQFKIDNDLQGLIKPYD
jgi:hypothetical protein